MCDVLEASLPIDDIAAELSRRYEATEDNIRRGSLKLPQWLWGDIVPTNDGRVRGTPAEPVSAERPPFGAHTLQKCTDIQDLILLDRAQ
jgi:hypothetical protein